MTEDFDELRRRAADLTARILEIEESLANGKREFFSGGAGHPMRERTELEAERASLRLQRHKLNGQIEQQRAAAKAQSQGALIAALCAELEARGLESIIALAKQKLAGQVEERA